MLRLMPRPRANAQRSEKPSTDRSCMYWSWMSKLRAGGQVQAPQGAVACGQPRPAPLAGGATLPALPPCPRLPPSQLLCAAVFRAPQAAPAWLAHLVKATSPDLLTHRAWCPLLGAVERVDRLAVTCGGEEAGTRSLSASNQGLGCQAGSSPHHRPQAQHCYFQHSARLVMLKLVGDCPSSDQATPSAPPRPASACACSP